MKEISFDLDGVLADTQRAVFEAYFAAGIVMPSNMWGAPAGEWLVAAAGGVTSASEAHARKQAHYREMLRQYGEPLAGVDVLRNLVAEDWGVRVVTHASWQSAVDALEWLGVQDVVSLHRTDDKRETLLKLRPDVHVDDHAFFCPVPLVEFINNSEELEARIREVT